MKATDPKFQEVVDKVIELHNKKGEDYGTDEDPHANLRAATTLGISPWVGATLRMADKERRIAKFVKGDELANESVYDSILDNAVYGLIRLMLYVEENG